MSRIRWFLTSPDEGPDCTCSWCGEPILEPPESDEDFADPGDDSPAIRMWDTDTLPMCEARFHPRCLREAMDAGEVQISSPNGGQHD